MATWEEEKGAVEFVFDLDRLLAERANVVLDILSHPADHGVKLVFVFFKGDRRDLVLGELAAFGSALI